VRRGHEFFGLDLPELDVTDCDAVAAAVHTILPDTIVNCAAFTAVDAAENDEEAARAVNATAVAHLAEASNEVGASLVQISTDYVFDGASSRPYREDDATGPLGAYGRTKLAGEAAAAGARGHLVVRTAWLFGDGANFVAAIRRQLDGGARTLRVVADQTGCPTYAVDLAEAILRLGERGARGLLHVVNDGSASWCDFAREIVLLLGAAAEVEPITTAQARRPAPRPAYSVLDASRAASLLGRPLPSWQDALGRYLAERGRGAGS
jgi:dTDP-4-dehydrorhamnose reductase